jgi:NhaP-type Na+/H+ or K+/H+ antiporter
VSTILSWEGTVLDPIGAVIAVVVFEVIQSSSGRKLGLSDLGSVIVHFVARVGVGVLAAAVGVAVLWLLLNKLKLSGLLATQAILATVIVTAAATNGFRDESGLIAAVVMGVAVANLPGIDMPPDRPFLKTIVQLVIGLLFISISATVTPASLKGVVGTTVALVAILILVVRPLVTVLATARRGLTPKERAFIGMMDPRGIVAASTAATFTAPLVALKLGGADKLLAATFLVIMLTVLVYGLSAVPAVRALNLREDPSEAKAASDG